MTLNNADLIVRRKLDLDHITESILKDVIELKRAIAKSSGDQKKRISRNVRQISANLDNMVRIKKEIDGLKQKRKTSTHKRKR